MMNQENTQAQTTINSTLTESVKSMASAVQELVELIKNEIAAEATSTTTETTATTTTDAEATETTTVGYLPCPPDAKTAEAATATATTETTTADAEFKGSMIEQDPMDPMPSAKTAEAAEDVAQKITDETAAEANAVADTEKMLDDIITDISALYNISSYALSNEGKNIESDRSPYAPKENKMGVIGDYQVFIAKEVIKDCAHVTGSFRLIIKDKTIVTPIMELELRLIDGHYKVFSSENTHRMEKMKEDHDLMRFLEITEEVSALVMSRYIAD